MLDLFLYNWQVREDWFKWCESLPDEELRKERVGGMGSILKNLAHIIDCEQLWINQMQQQPIIYIDMNTICTLNDLREFSSRTRSIVEEFCQAWTDDCEKKILEIHTKNGKTFTFTYRKIMHHIATHEVHHIGQLSVWARDIGIKPVSSDLLIRDFS